MLGWGWRIGGGGNRGRGLNRGNTVIIYMFNITVLLIGCCVQHACFISWLGERNPTSTKGSSRWKSSSENYLLIDEVRFRVRFRDSKTIFHENYLWWMSNCSSSWLSQGIYECMHTYFLYMPRLSTEMSSNQFSNVPILLLFIIYHKYIMHKTLDIL